MLTPMTDPDVRSLAPSHPRGYMPASTYKIPLTAAARGLTSYNRTEHGERAQFRALVARRFRATQRVPRVAATRALRRRRRAMQRPASGRRGQTGPREQSLSEGAFRGGAAAWAGQALRRLVRCARGCRAGWVGSRRYTQSQSQLVCGGWVCSTFACGVYCAGGG